MSNIDDAIERIVQIALGECGYTESGGPHGNDGNIVKYWDELDPALQGSYWCAVYLCWVLKRAGIKVPNIDRPYGWMNCGDAESWARANGVWSETGQYDRGDIGVGGHGSHTWLILADDGNVMETVEGNAQPGTGGDQTNGGAVWHRYRPHCNWVDGAIQVRKCLEKGLFTIGDAPTPQQPPTRPASAPPPPPPLPFPLPEGWYFGWSWGPDESVSGKFGHGSDLADWQRQMQRRGWDIEVDGEYGDQTCAVARAFQQDQGLTVDGEIGVETWNAAFHALVTQ